jgi:hypothetical protein
MAFLARITGKKFLGVFLALALFAPSFDMLVCAGDQEIAPPMTMAQNGETHEIAHKLHDDHNDGDTVCAHGHCHHGFSPTTIDTTPELAVTVTTVQPLRGMHETPRLSLLPELFRPPRA